MKRNVFTKVLVILIWISIWQLASMLSEIDILFPGPYKVLISLCGLVKTRVFYLSLFNSFIKITAGFILAFAAGVLLAAACHRFTILKSFIAPIVYLMKSLPVVSFIILLLMWTSSAYLSVYIAFIVVFPIIYHGTCEGISNLDVRILEMAEVFRMGRVRKIRYIYAPQVFSYITGSSKVALGMCWKAGISAEVIGLPAYSIGQQMYFSKLYLMADELLAWSVAIIIVSVIFEKLFMLILGLIKEVLER